MTLEKNPCNTLNRNKLLQESTKSSKLCKFRIFVEENKKILGQFEEEKKKGSFPSSFWVFYWRWSLSPVFIRFYQISTSPICLPYPKVANAIFYFPIIPLLEKECISTTFPLLSATPSVWVFQVDNVVLSSLFLLPQWGHLRNVSDHDKSWHYNASCPTR